MNLSRVASVVLAVMILPVARVQAAERLCDASFEDCRTPLINLIRSENVGIDVGFWFMEDARYSQALIDRWNAGVPVRIITDTESNAAYPANIPILQSLKDAGIPILEKTAGGIVHWKTMIFAGQNVVEFSGANYTPHAFVPVEPYVDYIDEVIYFSDDPAIVNSFKRRYDDVWITTDGYTPYANLSGTRTRVYPLYSISSEMNFPPYDNFATRSVDRYNAEKTAIDSIMFRIIDRRHTDALIAAVGRGVPVRLITDEDEYRDPTRLWNAYNIERLYMGGVQVKLEGHLGSLHQKSTLLRSQLMTVFGSSNWTRASATQQLEHNIFTKKTFFYQFFDDQFDRKWNNRTGNIETKPFVPQPPTVPQYVSPANAATNQPVNVTLKWDAGPWAHVYDIYLGATPDPPLLVSNIELGPSEFAGDYVTYDVAGLQQDQTYYWRIVSKTMANVTRSGTVWNFRTGTSEPSAGEGDIVLYAGRATTIVGRWSAVADSTAAGGKRMATADAGVKLSSPGNTDYFEMTFTADAGVPYHLWLRGKAQSNYYGSDSTFVQFSDSVTSTGSATFRIGTSTWTTVTIEDCSGCGLSGWGWNDNAYGTGALGPDIYFANSGQHTIRLYMREDGLSIDQIVLSRGPFLTAAPGATKNDGTILQEQGGDDVPPPPPPPPGLPSGWQSADVGFVGVAGSASESGGSYTVKGAGADIWGTSDAFHYAYRTLSGDGTIVARIASITGTQAWTKMGVMMRSSTASNAAYAFMLVSSGKGTAFQRRTANGVSATSTAGPGGTAPKWVRLQRSGNVITASLSSDGSAWTVVGSDTFTMPADVLIGLVAHSHDTSTLATAVYDNVSVTAGGVPPPPTLPAGWTSTDVGTVGVAGSSYESNGTYTVRGAGADVWGTTDAFHYANRPLSGDGTIVARLASITGTQAWTKMGVMIRSSTAPNAAFAFMVVSTSKGTAFQRRTADGVLAASTAGPAGTAPKWVRLQRSGNIITAAVSDDGSLWTVVGSDSFVMGSNVLVGLVAHSHTTSSLATGVYTNVSITP